MKVTWSDNTNSGNIDTHILKQKPTFSFEYEYIFINDEVSEYTPKERANYPQLTNISEADMISYYVNRPLSDEQKQEVVEWYNSFEAPQPTLEELKQKKINLAKIKRDADITAPYNNFDVSSDTDRERVTTSVTYFEILSQGGTTITWTMADSTEQDVTKAELQSVIDGVVIRTAQIFAQYQIKKADINASTSVEALNTIEV